ncbi:DUF3040 domain-containing protein [Streptomyces sp. ID05-26A]|nr:DUF3040 domain-containing protein [Streptomyces sp. ID05-26A]
MLSDRERETLCEIERALSAEDPRLASTLKGAERRVHPALGVVAALLTLVALVLGHLTGAIACALVAGWTWGAWQRRRTPGVNRSRVTD